MIWTWCNAWYSESVHALLLTPYTVIASTHSTYAAMMMMMALECYLRTQFSPPWMDEKSTAFNLVELIVLCLSPLLHMTKCVMCIERCCTHTQKTHMTHTRAKCRHSLGLPLQCCHIFMCIRVLMMMPENGTIKSQWTNVWLCTCDYCFNTVYFMCR